MKDRFNKLEFSNQNQCYTSYFQLNPYKLDAEQTTPYGHISTLKLKPDVQSSASNGIFMALNYTSLYLVNANTSMILTPQKLSPLFFTKTMSLSHS